MKLLIPVFLIISFSACDCSKKAQTANATNASTATEAGTVDASVIEQPMFPIGVFFTSMASGPADDAFLKKWVTEYTQKNNMTIYADRYSGCGKEGEYVVVMRVDKKDAAKALDFRAALEAVVKKQVATNKVNDPSSGPVNIEYGVKDERYSYCRLGGKKWL